MIELVFFLEEPSIGAMLEGLLPKILPEGVYPRIIIFEGKQDLEKRMGKKLQGYLNPNAQFIILRDQDSANCLEIKNNLRNQCIAANKPETLIRIVCHELESWYLADLAAVAKGLDLPEIANKQNKRFFRTPDTFPNPAAILRRIAPSYQKLIGSRAIGPYLDPNNTRSDSFRVFISGVRRLVAG